MGAVHLLVDREIRKRHQQTRGFTISTEYVDNKEGTISTDTTPIIPSKPSIYAGGNDGRNGSIYDPHRSGLPGVVEKSQYTSLVGYFASSEKIYPPRESAAVA